MNHELIDRLREDLSAARYRVDVLDALWGPAAAEALFRGRRQPAERALAARREAPDAADRAQPVESLARLFLLGLPVASADLDAALPRLGTEGARTLGIVGDAPSGQGAVRALLDLRPYSFVDAQGAGSWWILSDLGEDVLGHALGEDHVLGIGGASTTLSGLMIPRPVDSVLDLGTGCGIQALHAARHARRVVATDISRRALWMAEFNAHLNGVTGIEFRHGSLFEPVAGERFDRIVSNPPFVITPRVPGVPQYEYRDGGLVGDALVETVMRQAGEHLAPGGIAQLLGNWEYRAAPTAAAPARVADGLERVRGWVEDGGDGGAGDGGAGDRGDGGAGDAATLDGASLDAWVIERERQDAPRYAETWIRDGGTRPGTAEFDALYTAWLDDFDARGVREVGFGYILLRRPAAVGAKAQASATPAAASAAGVPTLARYERVESALGSNPVGLGDHLAACLAGHDWQVHRDDAELLRSTLVYASDVTEERHYWPGQDDPVVMTLRQGGGFGRSVPLDTALAAFVGACDGDLSVRALCGALAQVLSVDETALVADLLPAARALLADAILLPARA
ncbi:MAG: methyltransferase [Herbiconiux sp.]|nr:methyltransferase [Herbiconiux sp.]